MRVRAGRGTGILSSPVRRSRHFRISLLLSLVTASLLACSALSSFDDLQQAADEAGATRTDTSDPGTNDATLRDAFIGVQEDGTVESDSGMTVVDAAADATELSDTGADASPYCASLNPQPTFCNDFDPTTDAAPWTLETLPFTESSATITSERALSNPNSAKLVVNTTPSAYGGSSFLRTFSGPVTRVVTSYDLYVTAPPTLAMNLSIFKFPVAGFGDRYVSIQLGSSGKLTVFHNQDSPLGPDGGINYTIVGGQVSASLGAWMHIVLDVKTGNSPTVTASLNGVTFVNDLPIVAPLSTSLVRVKSGVSYLTKEAGTFTAYIDNVVIDVQ